MRDSQARADCFEEPLHDLGLRLRAHCADPDRLPAQRAEPSRDVDVVVVPQPTDEAVRVRARGGHETRDRVRQEVCRSERREAESRKPGSQLCGDLRVAGDSRFETFLLQEAEGAMECIEQVGRDGRRGRMPLAPLPLVAIPCVEVQVPPVDGLPVRRLPEGVRASGPQRSRSTRRPRGRPGGGRCTRSPRGLHVPVPRSGTRGRPERTRGTGASPVSRYGPSPTRRRSAAARVSRILRGRGAGAAQAPESAGTPVPWERTNDGLESTSICPDTPCHGTEEHGQSRIPSSDTLKTASASGRFGESMSRAIRLPPFDLRRYTRNVALWPTMWPPTGRVGSPKNASGFAWTWFVT